MRSYHPILHRCREHIRQALYAVRPALAALTILATGCQKDVTCPGNVTRKVNIRFMWEVCTDIAGRDEPVLLSCRRA